MQEKLSFFDIEGQNPFLFIKSPELQPPEPNEILLSSPFHIKHKAVNKKPMKVDKIKPKFLILTSKSLFLAKMKDKKPHKVMDFYLVRLRISNHSKMIGSWNKSKDLMLFNYSFVFLKFQDKFELFTNDFKLFSQWKNFLSLFLIQHTFHEDFAVIKMIGKGSFAKVYLAQKKENSKYFAVKAFNKEFLTNNTNKGKAALINEISITKQLDHPNIIKIYEVYETEHSIYLIMDLITGGDLLQKLNKKEKYQINDIKKIMSLFLEILHYIHNIGIMHRDLKPENILLRSENDVFDIVIADFGLATKIENSSVLFHHCGTPGFIAPEVLNYSKSFPFYNEKCDIYSLGIIFYILLTGKKPFYSNDLKKLIELNKSSNIDFNEPELLILSLETVDLLKKMLNYNPKLRLSAQECLQQSFFNQPEEDVFTFTNSEWQTYMENEINKELLSSNNNLNKTILFSNQSPLMSRHPDLNGRIDTVDGSSDRDVSPNITQHKVDIDFSTNSSKFANTNPGAFQLALMNTFFAGQQINKRNLVGGSPKKEIKNASHLFDNMMFNEEEVVLIKGKNRNVKKFTCLPKLITPIACEEVEEEDKKTLD